MSPEKALADWTHSTISSLVRVTLSPEPNLRDHRGHHLVYLPELRSEIEESRGGELRFEVDDIDSALREACSLYSHDKALLEYLLPVYKSTVQSLKARVSVPERLGVLQELKRLCMSNIVFSLTMPEYFG